MAQAVENLRQAIIKGHLAPGARLIERELCEMLGVSRTLVREALRQLEAEGWIENVPYRGPIVATTSADEARQLYEIRAALEGFAAKRCAERATADDLDDLSALVDDLASAEATSDLPHMLDVYRVLLRRGQRITVHLDGPANANTNLVLWKPGTERVDDVKTPQLRAAQSVKPGSVEQLRYRAERTGWYYDEA